MAQDKTKALVSLADAKRYLQIATTKTKNDRLIDFLTIEASERVQKELGRNIISQDYVKELHNSTPGKWLFLDHFPITSIQRVAVGRDIAATITYTGSGSAGNVEVTDNALKLHTTVSGTRTTSTFNFTDNATITNMKTSVDAISGWTMTITSGWESYPSSEFIRTPPKSAGNSSVGNTISLDVPDETETVDYEAYYDSGRLYNTFGWTDGKFNSIVVDYTAGYTRASIPRPLQGATLELVKIFFDISQKDSSLQREKIGDYEYELFQKNISNSLEFHNLPSSVTMRLSPFMRTGVWA